MVVDWIHISRGNKVRKYKIFVTNLCNKSSIFDSEVDKEVNTTGKIYYRRQKKSKFQKRRAVQHC